MAGRLFGAKPLSKPMLGYCQLDPLEQTSVKFQSKYKIFTHGNASENIVCEMAAIYPKGWVNMFNRTNVINAELMDNVTRTVALCNRQIELEYLSWWRHQMETFSALLAICAGIHRSPVNSPHKGPVTRSFDVFFISAQMKGWVNNGEAGDLRRNRAHYDVIVMLPHIIKHWIWG